jgi:hypothetical protein
MFINLFPENHPVYEIMSKNFVEPEGPQMMSQYGAYALHSASAKVYARTHMHTPTRPGTRTHAPPLHTQMYNTYCFSTATVIMLRYTYIVLLHIIILSG